MRRAGAACYPATSAISRAGHTSSDHGTADCPDPTVADSKLSVTIAIANTRSSPAHGMYGRRRSSKRSILLSHAYTSGG